MFSEPNLHNKTKLGSIEVICGPMFSGKTEELLRRLRRAKIANIPLAIFKPEIDIRFHQMRIVSHDSNYFPSMPIKSASDILKHSKLVDLIAIDEAQFFDKDIISVTQQLASQGKRIILAGLDMDYLGNPFGVMPEILCISDFVTKLNAICLVCGAPAIHSYRKVNDNNTVLVGEKESYEPRCRNCFSLQS